MNNQETSSQIKISRDGSKLIDTIIITMEEYRELLKIKGKYEELKDICNNKLTFPLLRSENMNHCESTPRHSSYKEII